MSILLERSKQPLENMMKFLPCQKQQQQKKSFGLAKTILQGTVKG